MGSILETVMLVCFGFSWPLNVMKAYKAKMEADIIALDQEFQADK